MTRTFLLALLLAPWAGAQADAAGDVCESLRGARIHLIALIGATNPRTLDNHAARLRAASDLLDARLTAMRQGQDTRDAARADEFEPVWRAFKATRESAIIPAVRAGDVAVAREIALGIQAERMKTMRSVMGCAR